METFHFLRPLWLLALLPLLLVLWRLYRVRYGTGNLARICDLELLPFLLIDRPGSRQTRFGLWLTGLGGMLTVIALAGPVWERVPVPVFRNENALVIVLDLSTAMDATDLKPSRLERARYKIADLLRARRDGQTGLVVYAGDAFTVTPLTNDTATISSQLGALSTELSPVQGRRVDLALEAAVRLLRQAGIHSGHVLLMTSDLESGSGVDAARRVREAGYRLSVLGVGTEAGGPVPRGRAGLWKDAEGNILVPKLNPSALRQLAEQGDGLYRPIAADSADIDRLSAFFQTSPGRQGESSEPGAKLDRWIERGPWLVLALLPIAALAFRRGGLLALLWVLAVPKPSEAFEWRDLWSKPDRRAEAEFDRQQFEAAARQFEDPAWRGAAWYRAGKYQEALQALKDVDSTDGWYNKGNALARMGDFAEAIAAYRKVLDREPEHADAKHNKELLEQFMKKKEQKKQSGSSGDQPDNAESAPEETGQQQSRGQGGGREGDSGQSESESRDQAESSARPSSAEAEPPQQESAAKNEAPADAADPQGEHSESPKSVSEESDEAEHGDAGTETELSEQREVQQANEQWLRRIPDDPAGLLRRKFAWQYRQRMNQENE